MGLRRSVRLVSLLASLLVAASNAVAPTRAAAGSEPGPLWRRPVPGPVVVGFDPPRTEFGGGHRGVDLAASPGDPVLAAGAGVVEFAGTVAFSRHVVVLHANGWRTSYSFLASVSVREGDRVVAGTVVGTCCGGGHGVGIGGLVHFGLRAGDAYLDPTILFRPPDLAALVHLAPADGREWPAERRSAIRMVLDVTGVSTALDWGGAALDGAALFTDGLGALLSAGGDQLPDLVRFLDELDPSPIGPNAALDVVQGTLSWLDQRDECDHNPPQPGAVAQPNRLMFVAGINSASGRDGATNDFPAERIGYQPDEIEWFSYAADRGSYVATDTHAPIEESAANLATQLRAMQTAQPGRSVDLIAHSQGGVVVQAFLKLYYDPGDATLPPIGTVITLASPHTGAPVATSADLIADRPIGAVALDAIPGLPPSDAASVRDLSELSALNARLRDRALPPGLEVYSVGAPFDYVVPETATHLDGAHHVTVDPAATFSQHSSITTDEATHLVVNNALLGRPMPCVSLRTSLASAYFPERIAFVERVPGVLSLAGYPTFP